MAALRSSLASTTATAAAVGTSGRVFFQSASFASCSSRSSSFASSTSARAQAPAASPPPPPPSWTPAAPSISDLILGSDPAYESVQHARFSSSDKGKGREVVGSGLDLYHYSTYPPGLPDHDRPTLLVLNSANLVDAALMYLKGPVGLDIEWKPTYLKGGGMNPTSVLQICDAQTILVIQTRSMLHSPPPRLRAFLEDPLIVKVGVGIMGDAAKLSKDLKIQCRGFVDLNSLAPRDPNNTEKGLTSLAKMTARWTGRELLKNKQVQCSNWSARALSDTQITYAANDAHCSYSIYASLFKHSQTSSEPLPTPPGWDWSLLHAQPAKGHPRVPDDVVRRLDALRERPVGFESSLREEQERRGTARVGWGKTEQKLRLSPAGQAVLDRLLGRH